jgi:hypothetical protein
MKLVTRGETILFKDLANSSDEWLSLAEDLTTKESLYVDKVEGRRDSDN